MTATSAIIELFGEKLASGTEEVKTVEALAGAVTVGIYFSAHWCPPCKGFTPKLAKWYTDNLKAKGMEIVFVSSDKDEGAFSEYFAEMPWLALPFSDRDRKAKLSKKYKVQGIPTFVVLDGATGELITTDGREAVTEDPTGQNLPWKPPTIWDALGTEFLNGTEETVEIDELTGDGGAKVLGLYFSAHWCPPCRQFTPMLVSAYTEHLKAKGLQIIFVSSDKDQTSFMEYYGTMPWLAIPQGDARKAMLSKLFGVQGIPALVLIDAKTGATINTNARGKVMSDPKGDDFPFAPKPLNDMVAEGPGDINETPTLCAMLEGCDAAVATAALKTIEPIAADAKQRGDDLAFLYATKAEEPTGQIRALTKLGSPSAAPQLVILDIPDDGGYYVSPATEVTADTVNGFLAAFKAGSLDRQQLG